MTISKESKRPLLKNPLELKKMNNTNKLMFFAKRLPTRSHAPPSISRFFCSPSSPSPPPHNKLFVAGLTWSADEKLLKDAFSSFGEVTEVRIMYDKDTGRSRGFGFVYFSKGEEAKSAKDAMDGKALMGRPLRISFALDKVRGSPVVVPRLRNSADGTNQSY